MKRHKRLLAEINERISHPPYGEIRLGFDSVIYRDSWVANGKAYFVDDKIIMHPDLFRLMAVKIAGWVIPTLLDGQFSHPRKIAGKSASLSIDAK